jgi:hypothetical protein
VSALYRESDPHDARIDSFLSLWFLPMFFVDGEHSFWRSAPGSFLSATEEAHRLAD